ncbi:hypothetical protein C8F01DRAFT_280 [Mycena amicta]|nr:hypothetical protein C8F01DRAFT_280 [Mycena amicta]
MSDHLALHHPRLTLWASCTSRCSRTHPLSCFGRSSSSYSSSSGASGTRLAVYFGCRSRSSASGVGLCLSSGRVLRVPSQPCTSGAGRRLSSGRVLRVPVTILRFGRRSSSPVWPCASGAGHVVSRLAVCFGRQSRRLSSGRVPRVPVMTMYFGCWSSSLVWPCTLGAGLACFRRLSSLPTGSCCF